MVKEPKINYPINFDKLKAKYDIEDLEEKFSIMKQSIANSVSFSRKKEKENEDIEVIFSLIKYIDKKLKDLV